MEQYTYFADPNRKYVPAAWREWQNEMNRAKERAEVAAEALP
jgi:hypothetical protein